MPPTRHSRGDVFARATSLLTAAATGRRRAGNNKLGRRCASVGRQDAARAVQIAGQLDVVTCRNRLTGSIEAERRCSLADHSVLDDRRPCAAALRS